MLSQSQKFGERHLAIFFSILLLVFLYFSDLMRVDPLDEPSAANIELLTQADTTDAEGLWQKSIDGHFRIGEEGVVWVRLRGEMFPSSLAQERILSINRTNIDTIIFEHRIDGKVVTDRCCGNSFDHSIHPVITPYPAFPVFASAGEHEAYLRLSARPGVEGQVTYGPATLMFERAVRISSRRSAFFGGQLLVALVVLLVSLRVREARSGVYLALFAISSVGTDLLINGYSFPALWPKGFAFTLVLPAFSTLMLYAQMRLAYHIFTPPERNPRLSKVIDCVFIIPVFVLFFVTAIFGETSFSVILKSVHLIAWFLFFLWLLLYSRSRSRSNWPWVLIFLPFNLAFLVEYMVFSGVFYFATGFIYEASAFLMTVGVALFIAFDERKLFREVERQRRWLDLTLHSIGDGVMVMGMDRKIFWVNAAIEKLFEQPASELVGKNLIELRDWREETSSLFRRELDLVLKTKTVGRFFSFKVLFSAQSRPLYLSLSFSPIFSSRGGADQLILLVRDLTERTLLEERLNHTERMESMGRLASGVAHDFNNTLSGIAGLAELLSQNIEQPEKAKSLAADIVEAADGSREMISALLNFAHPRARKMEPLDLHKVIENALGLSRLAPQLGIVVKRRFEMVEAKIIGDAVALQDAILNILINAKDEMLQGGVIEVKTRTISLTKEECEKSGLRLQLGDYVELTISDAGVGISDEHLAHIFEPFYTTKPEGKGTGLGLPTVYSTVVAHDGAIEVESVLGQGTRFIIKLPLRSEKMSGE